MCQLSGYRASEHRVPIANRGILSNRIFRDPIMT